jgi:ribonuclease J
MKMMLNLTRPRYVLPVHGDHQRIRLHAELAEEVGVPPENVFKGRNGLPLEIDKRGASFGEEQHSGVILVDGIDLADPNDASLRDRRTISSEGICILVATIASDDGELVVDPEVIARGISSLEEDSRLLDEIAELVEDSLADSADAGVKDLDLIQTDLHDRVASFIHKRLKRRPMIVPVITEV